MSEIELIKLIYIGQLMNLSKGEWTATQTEEGENVHVKDYVTEPVIFLGYASDDDTDDSNVLTENKGIELVSTSSLAYVNNTDGDLFLGEYANKAYLGAFTDSYIDENEEDMLKYLVGIRKAIVKPKKKPTKAKPKAKAKAKPKAKAKAKAKTT